MNISAEASMEFIDFLLHLRNEENHGVLADLRSGLLADSSTSIKMYVHLGDFLSEKPDQVEECYLMLASLFAYHPLNRSDNCSFGKTLREFSAQKQQMSNSKQNSFDKRVLALLNSNSKSVRQHLRQMVGQLRTESIPIDWYRLLSDLLAWNYAGRPVQRRWARDFWRTNRERSELNARQEATEQAEETEKEEETNE